MGHLERLREARQGVNWEVYGRRLQSGACCAWQRKSHPPYRLPWRVEATDARGNVTDAVMGNGMDVSADYDPATGQLLFRSDTAGSEVAQMFTLEWDEHNRLTTRSDQRSGSDYYEERFDYDDQNRLALIESKRNGETAWTEVEKLEFDAAGNITQRSGVGDYQYTSLSSHRLSQAGNRSFVHVANGNVMADRVSGNTDRRKIRTASKSPTAP